MSQAIDAYGEDMHEMNIYSVLFVSITVKQSVSLEIPDYGTSIFNIAQKMDMAEKVQQLKDKHVELFFSPVTEFEGDELDLMKKWASSHMENRTLTAVVTAIRYLSFLGLYGDFTAVMVFVLDPNDFAFYEDIGPKLDATLMSKKKKAAVDKLNESLGQVRDNFVVNLPKEGKHLDILKHFSQDFLPYADVFSDVAPPSR